MARPPAVRTRTLALARPVVRTLFAVSPCRAIGAEWTEPGTPAFLIANHRSMADAFAVYLTSRRFFAGPAKAQLFQIPIFGRLFAGIGAYPVESGGRDHRAALRAADIYRSGGSLLVFPEGRRNTGDTLLPFSPDLARLIIKLEAPMIPVGIAGTEEVLPPGHWLPRRSRVVVAYGEQFELGEFYGRPLTADDRQRAAGIMRDRVSATLERATEQRLRMRRKPIDVRL